MSGFFSRSQTGLLKWLFVAVLLLLPLGLGLAWGPYLADRVYLLLSAARLPTVPIPPRWSLVGWLLLRLAVLLGIDLAWGALLLSLLGWGTTAVFLFLSGRRTWPAGLLVAFCPVFLPTLGTAIPWLLALGSLAIWLTGQRRWGAQTAVLALLPLIYFDLTAVALLTLLWGGRWLLEQHFPARAGAGLLLALALSVGWFVGVWQLPARWDGVLVQVMLVIAILFLANWLVVRWVERLQMAGRLGAGSVTAAGLLLFGLLAGGQGIGWQQAWRERPLVWHQLENEAGRWLRDHTPLSATVWANPRTGYLAQRPLLMPTLPQVGLLPLLTPSVQPDYVLTARTIAADQLTRAAWFQEAYAPVAEFSSPFEAAAPLIVWGYRPTLFGLGDGRPLNVKAPPLVDVVGYQLHPPLVQPGQPVQVTLFLRPQMVLTQPFYTVIRLGSPLDGREWSVTSFTTPLMAAPGDWPAGVVQAETFPIIVPLDAPVGAYTLNFSLRATAEEEPLLALYRNNDTNRLDRVVLGSVAVPWEGEVPGTAAAVARFGEQIELVGFSLNEGFTRGGEPLRLTLYWQALHPPPADYVVFVHLLDASGQLMANQDGPPRNGRWPTSTWLPLATVPDEHVLPLSGELSPGSYRLAVGLYLPQTGERLPVWGADGAERPERSWELTAVAFE